MAKLHPSLGAGPAILDLRSYARHGPGRRDRLSSEQLALISRTVHRAPEVMVKVLNRGAKDLKTVARHLGYLSRSGKLELETDEGQKVAGKGAGKALVEDWDLGLDESRRSANPWGQRKEPPRLVHKLIFSMPPGTPPDKVLLAVKNFAREEWGAKHRYALVLHTDEPHPHVHVVVKAMSEEGQRLNIRKDTLRRWRQGFARHLRDLGVPANATERAARGVSKKAKLDGIYRAAARGDSTHYRQRAEAVARSLRQGAFAPEAGKETLMAIRREVIRGWGGLRDQLLEEGHTGLARAVDEFTTQMPPPLTDNERIKSALLSAAEKARARKIPQPGREPEQKEAKRDPEASPSPPERER